MCICQCRTIFKEKLIFIFLSLSFLAMSHVSDIFFHLVKILKHNCVYTQIFAHKKKIYVVPIAESL